MRLADERLTASDQKWAELETLNSALSEESRKARSELAELRSELQGLRKSLAESRASLTESEAALARAESLIVTLTERYDALLDSFSAYKTASDKVAASRDAWRLTGILAIIAALVGWLVAAVT